MRGDLLGGISSAVVSLGILLPLGLLSFAALGADAGSVGIRAAFVASIVGGAMSAMVGSGVVPGSGAKTSTTLIFAGFVAVLCADPALRADTGSILLLTSLCVGLAGLLQVLFAVLRLGSIVSFVPLPVVAGFMDGIAILIAISQIQALLGVPADWRELGVVGVLDRLQLTGLGIGIATAAVAWILARRLPRSPWALLGLLFGTALYWLVVPLLAGASPGPLLGAPASGLPLPLLGLVAMPEVAPLLQAHLLQLVTTATVLALIGSLDGLLSAVGVDTRLNTRHDLNRVLLGQGLGTLASAFFGGLPIVNLPSAQLAAHRAGGRSRASGLVCASVLMLILFAGRSFIDLVPAAATAGVMIIVGFGLFDQWSRSVWRQLRGGMRDRDAVWALATAAMVCVITIFFGFVAGIAVGVALSIALFVGALNRSLVRAVATGETRGSRRIYAPGQVATLRERGACVRLVELEGAIFFGTAHKLGRQMEELSVGARFLILDIRRVTMIDASGAIALERLSSRVRSKGVQLLLAGLVAGDRHARVLRAHAAFARSDDRQWFADADLALEHAERRLLDEAGQQVFAEELPLDRLSLFEAMDATQLAKLSAYLSRVELATREVLFRRGEPGDCLYVLAKGSISIVANVDDGIASAHRLASFTPGVVFGEAAMLDSGGRTAGAVADEPSVVYVLTRAALATIREREPALAYLVLLNIARQLSARLRFATATIQAADR